MQDKYFFYLLNFSYICYFLLFFNFFDDPIYLKFYLNIIKAFIPAFLLFRFNPLVNYKFTKLDKKIVFHAALSLFSISTFETLFDKFFTIKGNLIY